MISGVAALLVPLWTLWLARGLVRLYGEQSYERPNYRGIPVAPVLGPALLLGYLPALVAAAAGEQPLVPLAMAALLLGAAFYGLWDDFLSGEERGFRGHLGALRRGRVTAGQLKIAAGVAAALFFSTALPLGFRAGVLAFFLVLLSANGLNLLDRRPGRALKVFFAGTVLLAFAAPQEELLSLLVPLLAAALALAPLDLGAQGMLGDCGSNLLGAALGAGAVLALPVPAQAALLAGWLALHLVAEVSSVSDLVERCRFLKTLDALGRWREKLS